MVFIPNLKISAPSSQARESTIILLIIIHTKPVTSISCVIDNFNYQFSPPLCLSETTFAITLGDVVAAEKNPFASSTTGPSDVTLTPKECDCRQELSNQDGLSRYNAGLVSSFDIAR